MFINDRKAEIKQKEEIKKNITENKNIYVETFTSPSGTQVLKDLRRRCFEDITTFDDNPHKMAFNEGRRSIFKHIDNIINKDVEDILKELE